MNVIVMTTFVEMMTMLTQTNVQREKVMKKKMKKPRISLFALDNGIDWTPGLNWCQCETPAGALFPLLRIQIPRVDGQTDLQTKNIHFPSHSLGTQRQSVCVLW